MNISKLIYRCKKVIKHHRFVFGELGHHNYFSKGVILYENSKIGNYNYFSPYVLVNNAQIGNYCSIGPSAKIGLGEHNTGMISTYPSVGDGAGSMSVFDFNRPTIIENDVWIGANVMIKQGVRIGNGAVIGAGSVVTKDVQPFSIVYGVPAKHIRFRFSDSTIKEIIESKWYEREIIEAKKIVHNIKESVDKL